MTDRLYGGNSEHRLRQELLLGVGGVRALRVFSRITGHPAPEVFHTNEGHAGFLGIERIRELTVAEDGPQVDWDTAVEMGRASTVFTTHTPVPGRHRPVPADAGGAVLRRDRRHARRTAGEAAGPRHRGLRRRRRHRVQHGGDGLPARPARQRRLAAARPASAASMFNGLWPAFDEAEVPIGSITNGVHAPTWVAREMFDLAAAHGADTYSDDVDALLAAVDKVPGNEVWAVKRQLRERLVNDARRRLAKSWQKRGAAAAELKWIDSALDPDVLTIGFARRAASYKRLTLMMRDPERLKRLLLHPERPIQLVIAGKAHPADDGGKKLIQDIVKLSDDPEIRHRIVFLPNYDIAMAQPLYPGCDVWLNNPLRPYEACGTSGMKAALNGGLNLSVLDGWWDEWYDGDNGWAIPTADGVDDVDKRDDLEAEALYELIENDVAPALLRPRRRRLAHPLAGDGPAHAEVARSQGAGHPDGPRLRPRALRPGRANSRLLNSDYSGAARAGGLEEAGEGRLAVGPRRARRVLRRRRRRRGRRGAHRAGVRLARRPRAGGRRTCRCCTARSTATTC